MSYKSGSLSRSIVSNETAIITERLESIESRLTAFETVINDFNNSFSSIQRKERALWKNFSNEELRLYQQTQSSMMGSVKSLQSAVNIENKESLDAIRKQGFILSNKTALTLLILFYIAFGGWMICLVELLK